VIAPARRAAVAALIDLGAGRGDLPHAMARMRASLDDRRDGALAAEIVAGTLRWQARLDALIAGASERAVEAIAPPARAVLRAAVFQIDHLDRVPVHAVVHDAVEQVRDLRLPALAGFVNAVLRRIADPRRRPPLPPLPAAGEDRDGLVGYLSVVESHPPWLAGRWLDRDGFEQALATMRFNNERAPLTVRVHRSRMSRDAFIEAAAASGLAAEPCRYAPAGVILAANAHLDEVPALEGCYTIQDEGSQLVACAVGAEAGHRVLDACAAPGGKSMAMAEATGPGGLIVAADYRAKRVALLARTVAGQAPPIRVVRHDLGAGAPFGPVFDRVLVDAPCSGLGTLRRDPDIKWTRREADLAEFSRRQRHLLAEASTAVAPGGRLVYATCSSEPDENEAVVDAFLGDHAAFGRGPLPGWMSNARPGQPALTNSRSELATHPARHGLEHFFAAVLIRRG
jgi:16S rRNA (cytosine967-C5)-methyltransferase